MANANFSFKNATNAQSIANGNTSIQDGSFHFEVCNTLLNAFSGCDNLSNFSVTGVFPEEGNYCFYQSSTSNNKFLGKTIYDVFPELKENPKFLYNSDRLAYLFTNTNLEGDVGIFDDGGNPTVPLYIGNIQCQDQSDPRGIYMSFSGTKIKRAYVDVLYNSWTDSGYVGAGKSLFYNCKNLEYAKVILQNKNTSYGEFGKSMFNGCSSLKKVELQLPNGCFSSTFSNCTSLEEIYITNTSSVFYYSSNGMLNNCSSLKKLIWLEGSVTPTAYGLGASNTSTLSVFGNGVTYFDLETMKNWAGYNTKISLTSIYDPIHQKSGTPTQYSLTLGRLGLDKTMVDDNGITCIINVSDAEEQEIEYDFVDEGGTQCVRKDSELYTALTALKNTGWIWTMVYH